MEGFIVADDWIKILPSEVSILQAVLYFYMLDKYTKSVELDVECEISDSMIIKDLGYNSRTIQQAKKILIEAKLVIMLRDKKYKTGAIWQVANYDAYREAASVGKLEEFLSKEDGVWEVNGVWFAEIQPSIGRILKEYVLGNPTDSNVEGICRVVERQGYVQLTGKDGRVWQIQRPEDRRVSNTPF